MMSYIRQTVSVTLQNLKSIRYRLGNSLVALLGVAGVVLVFVAVLSMAYGFQKTLASGGSDDNVVILRSGATSEMESSVSGEQARIISDAPGIARRNGQALASAELYVMVDVKKRNMDAGANLPMRGLQTIGRDIRRNVNMIEGRWFEEGKQELIAGVAAYSQFDGLEVGSTLRFGQQVWNVVGLFEAGGGIDESELWADVRVLQGAYRRGNGYSAMRVKLDSPEQFAAFKDHLSADPRLALNVLTEPEFYAEQAQALSTLVRVAGFGIAALMALGAIFGAINTMYSAVSARTREIATLRALGFANSAIVISVIVEALLVAAIGGLVGGLIAYVIFNGFTVSTLNFASFSQVVFSFAVTPQLMQQGIMLALVIGLLGGLFPAWRAARLPVSTALREL